MTVRPARYPKPFAKMPQASSRSPSPIVPRRQLRTSLNIAIVGDFDPAFPPHPATDTALRHGAAALDFDIRVEWLPTDRIADAASMLAGHDAVVVAPGSPYRSMGGALSAIQYARTCGLPLLGTCGGFQHVVLEYARSVMGLTDVSHAEYDPYASLLFVTPLSCSLVGQAMSVTLDSASRVAALYGGNSATEQYYCNFGLNPDYGAALDAAGLRIVGRDSAGEARVVELPTHAFFVATLFVPQLSSRPDRAHPLILGLLSAATTSKS